MQAFDNYTTLAIVKTWKVDSEGAFADVVTVPEQNGLTVHIQANYAGPSFGLWLPLAVDDLVVISVCDGNPNSDGVITGRIWSGSEEPPALAQSDPDHISLTGKEEVRIVLLARKANIALRAETSGNINLEVADGSRVNIGSENPTEQSLLGNKTVTAFNTWTTAFNTGAAALPVAATDLTTVIALANAIRLFLLSFVTGIPSGINPKLIADLQAALSQVAYLR